MACDLCYGVLDAATSLRVILQAEYSDADIARMRHECSESCEDYDGRPLTKQEVCTLVRSDVCHVCSSCRQTRLVPAIQNLIANMQMRMREEDVAQGS
jgi:hypothetical protein